MTKVMIFGTFDVLHEGHKNYMNQAREHGDVLVAVVALDSTVKKIKKKNPVNNQQIRLANLEKSGWVDKVVIGREDDKLAIVLEEKPDVLCFGYDQTFFTDGAKEDLASKGLKVKIYRLKPFKPEIYKSSLIRSRQQAENKRDQQDAED